MKKLFIGCGIALGVLVVIVVVAGTYLFYKVKDVMKAPTALETPAVITGGEFLKKDVLIANSVLGNVSDIVTDLPGHFLGVTGLKGALLFDSGLNVRHSVYFNSRASHMDFVDVEGDGKTEFMERGAWGVDAGVYYLSGAVRWIYGGGSGVNDMSAGNFDNDSNQEFVVGFNGGDGVHLVDENGKRLWKQDDGNVWHVEAVDVDNDGLAEILHSNASGELTVRNAQGTVLRKIKPQSYFSEFSLMDTGARHIIHITDDSIQLLDYEGRVIKDFKAPPIADFAAPSGTRIQWDASSPPLYAFALAYENWNRCSLYLYNEEGDLLYHEILAEMCGAMTVVPDASTGPALLVGGHSKVLRYSK